MTKADWDMVLCGNWRIGRKIKPGDEIIIEYRCNWHRGRAYKKPDKVYIGSIECINEIGVRFQDGKRLSYRSISDISFHTKDALSGYMK